MLTSWLEKDEEEQEANSTIKLVMDAGDQLEFRGPEHHILTLRLPCQFSHGLTSKITQRVMDQLVASTKAIEEFEGRKAGKHGAKEKYEQLCRDITSMLDGTKSNVLNRLSQATAQYRIVESGGNAPTTEIYSFNISGFVKTTKAPLHYDEAETIVKMKLLVHEACLEVACLIGFYLLFGSASADIAHLLRDLRGIDHHGFSVFSTSVTAQFLGSKKAHAHRAPQESNMDNYNDNAHRCFGLALPYGKDVPMMPRVQGAIPRDTGIWHGRVTNWKGYAASSFTASCCGGGGGGGGGGSSSSGRAAEGSELDSPSRRRPRPLTPIPSPNSSDDDDDDMDAKHIKIERPDGDIAR